MAKDIFPDRSQAAEELLGGASSVQVLIVPVDFAKKKHIAQICRSNGTFLFRRPMALKNTVAEAEYLLNRIGAYAIRIHLCDLGAFAGVIFLCFRTT